MIHNFLQLDEASPAAASAADRVGRELGRLLRRRWPHACLPDRPREDPLGTGYFYGCHPRSPRI